MIRVERPEAEKKKIQCRNEFELCYLRHRYIRKTKYNPTEEEMKPYMNIASKLARNTFFIYKKLFHIVGLESEDVTSVANTQIVSFLGLFRIQINKEKYDDFVRIFKKNHDRVPDEDEILYKDQANFTLFLKQRMQDLVRVCRQKAKNIKGLPAESYYFYHGQKKPPKDHRDLIKDYEKLGYRKLDVAIYKSIKKKYSEFEMNFMVGDTYYIAVPLSYRSLTLNDLSSVNLDPHDSLHNMNPESVFLAQEDEELWEKKREAFESMPVQLKMSAIRRFIRKNVRNKMFAKEVDIAKALLRRLERNGR